MACVVPVAMMGTMSPIRLWSIASFAGLLPAACSSSSSSGSGGPPNFDGGASFDAPAGNDANGADAHGSGGDGGTGAEAGAPGPFATGFQHATQLVTDTQFIYVNDTGPSGQALGVVYKVPLTGGPKTPLAMNLQFGVIAASDATHIYGFDGQNGTMPSQNVWALDKSNGTKTVLATGQPEVNGMTVDANDVYWGVQGNVVFAGMGSLLKAPKDGSGSAQTIASSLGDPSGVAVDSTGNIFWTDGTQPNGISLFEIPAGGGAQKSLAAGFQAGSVQIDTTSAYWIQGADPSTNHPAAIMSVPLSGGTPTAVYSDSMQFADIVAYVLDQGTIYLGDHSDILKVPKAGGAATKLATCPTGGFVPGIATDAANVYYACSSTTVFRAPK